MCRGCAECGVMCRLRVSGARWVAYRGLCWLLRGSFYGFCCPRASARRSATTGLAAPPKPPVPFVAFLDPPQRSVTGPRADVGGQERHTQRSHVPQPLRHVHVAPNRVEGLGHDAFGVAVHVPAKEGPVPPVPPARPALTRGEATTARPAESGLRGTPGGTLRATPPQTRAYYRHDDRIAQLKRALDREVAVEKF